MSFWAAIKRKCGFILYNFSFVFLSLSFLKITAEELKDSTSSNRVMFDENNSPIPSAKKAKRSQTNQPQKRFKAFEHLINSPPSNAKAAFSDEVLIPDSPIKKSVEKVAIKLFDKSRTQGTDNERCTTTRNNNNTCSQQHKNKESPSEHSLKNTPIPMTSSPLKHQKPLQTAPLSPKSPQKKKMSQENMIQKSLIFSPQSKNKIHKGLRNIGNSCYINSVLECLLNAEPFCKDITCDWVKSAITQAPREEITSPEKSTEKHSLDVLLSFVSLVTAYRNDDREVLVPKELKESICKHCTQFSSGQQDAHEFLLCFLDLLNKQLETAIELIKCKQTPRLLQEKLISPVKKNFQFNLNRLFRCETCSRVFTINEPVTALSLSFGDGATSKKTSLYNYFSNTGSPSSPCACSVQDIIRNFFSESTAECNCAACGKNRAHTSYYTIKNLPRFLLLHLKRFYLNKEMHQLDKRTDSIRLDDIIDLSAFVSDDTTDPEPFDHNFNVYPKFNSPEKREVIEERNPTVTKRGVYRLQSVVCHVGSLQLGHYTSYVRIRPHGTTTSCHCDGCGGWRHYDDSLLVDVKETPKTNAIYLLVYALEECKQTQ